MPKKKVADRPFGGAVSRFIEEEAGYALYQAVSGAKAALSRAPSTTLRFEHAR